MNFWSSQLLWWFRREVWIGSPFYFQRFVNIFRPTSIYPCLTNYLCCVSINNNITNKKLRIVIGTIRHPCKLFESHYENWLPKTKVIMIETHDRMIPKCSYTVMETINRYDFILYTTTEGTLIYFNTALVDLTGF